MSEKSFSEASGRVMVTEQKGKKEIIRHATSEDMKNASAAVKQKYAGRVRQQEREPGRRD